MLVVSGFKSNKHRFLGFSFKNREANKMTISNEDWIFDEEEAIVEQFDPNDDPTEEGQGEEEELS